jgi:hypothetical protein
LALPNNSSKHPNIWPWCKKNKNRELCFKGMYLGSLRLSHHSDWIARPTMEALIKGQPLLVDQLIRRPGDNKSSLVRIQPICDFGYRLLDVYFVWRSE